MIRLLATWALALMLIVLSVGVIAHGGTLPVQDTCRPQASDVFLPCVVLDATAVTDLR